MARKAYLLEFILALLEAAGVVDGVLVLQLEHADDAVGGLEAPRQLLALALVHILGLQQLRR